MRAVYHAARSPPCNSEPRLRLFPVSRTMVVERLVVAACLLLAWRVWVTLPLRWRQRSARQSAQQSPEEKIRIRQPRRTVNTLVVLGSGERASNCCCVCSDCCCTLYATYTCAVLLRTRAIEGGSHVVCEYYRPAFGCLYTGFT